MKVYIIRDKVSKTYAGTPFLANNDDEATRIFHLSACKSPFKVDLELRCLGSLGDDGIGLLGDNEKCIAPVNAFVSDYSDSITSKYLGGVEDEEQA